MVTDDVGDGEHLLASERIALAGMPIAGLGLVYLPEIAVYWTDKASCCRRYLTVVSTQ